MSIFSSNKKNTITSIGSALVDFIINSDDNFVNSLGIKKGDMTSIDTKTFKSILTKAKKFPIILPGGSACNTAIGIAKLNATSNFICKIGNDPLGTFFKTNLLKNQINSVFLNSTLPTGRVISIVTPDKERTMLTYLGASSEINPKEVLSKYLKESNFLHLEGYLFFNPDLIINILKIAKKNNIFISLDLASPSVIKNNIKLIKKIVPKYIDLLIANKEEAQIYTNHIKKEYAITEMSKQVKIAVIKLGHKGSIVKKDNTIFKILPYKTNKIVDTTGAGDLWASGFLFGIANNLSIKKSAQIGSICGSKACEVMGNNITKQNWYKINKSIKNIKSQS